jgi:hypothetical protein
VQVSTTEGNVTLAILKTARDIDASGGDLGLRDGPAQTLKTFVWLR